MGGRVSDVRRIVWRHYVAAREAMRPHDRRGDRNAPLGGLFLRAADAVGGEALYPCEVSGSVKRAREMGEAGEIARAVDGMAAQGGAGRGALLDLAAKVRGGHFKPPPFPRGHIPEVGWERDAALAAPWLVLTRRCGFRKGDADVVVALADAASAWRASLLVEAAPHRASGVHIVQPRYFTVGRTALRILAGVKGLLVAVRHEDPLGPVVALAGAEAEALLVRLKSNLPFKKVYPHDSEISKAAANVARALADWRKWRRLDGTPSGKKVEKARGRLKAAVRKQRAARGKE